MDEIIWNGLDKKVFIGLDFFDASINRIAAWVIGARNARKALLSACLANTARFREAENAEDYTKRLALLEERKSMPFAPVWDYYCMTKGIPAGESWIDGLKKYESEVQFLRV